MASSTLGSSTMIDWKRRSRARSFSMVLRYSSVVVAPTTCSAPRLSAGFRMFAASSEPSAEPASDDRVQFVDEQDDLAFALGGFLDDVIKTLLEFAAVLGAGDERTHVQLQHALALQCVRDFASAMRWARPSTMAVLPTPGLTDEHRVVLGLAVQDVNDAFDLAVATDDRLRFLSLALAVMSSVK